MSQILRLTLTATFIFEMAAWWWMSMSNNRGRQRKNWPRSRRKSWWRPYEYEKASGQCADRAARPAGQSPALVAHHAGDHYRLGSGDLPGGRGTGPARAP